MDQMIITNLIAIGTLLLTVTGLFIWNRAEGRSDNRTNLILIKDLHERMTENNERTNERIANLIEAIHLEMKDFHGRLCSLEATKHDRKNEK